MSSRKSAAPLAPFVPPTNPNQILSTEAVAAWLGVETRAVFRLGVPQLKLGHKTKRYRVGDVQAWLDKHTITKKQKSGRRRP